MNCLTLASKYFAGIVEHSPLGLAFLQSYILLQVSQARASLQGIIFCRFSIRPSTFSLFLTGLISLFSGYKLCFRALTSYTSIKLVFFAVLVVFRWLETQFPASLELYAKIALFLNTRGINWSASAVKEVGLNWFTQSLEPNASSFRNNLLHTSLTSII